MELISERFQRLPAIQQQREQEYQQQAREASSLVQRLDQTRKEAERVAIAEIETTKRMMEREVRQHPDWLGWRKQYEEVASKARQWDAGRAAALARLQQDLQRVKEEVDGKARDYDALLGAQERARTERAALENDTFTGREQLQRLHAELSQLQDKERDLNRAFAEHNSIIVSLNEQLTDIRQEINRKERDNAVKQQHHQQTVEQIKAREHELDHVDMRIGDAVSKKATAEQNMNHLSGLEAQLSSQLAESPPKPLFEDAQARLREAEENLRIAMFERDRFREEQHKATGNLSMLSGEVSTLHRRQQVITDEINKLLEERRAIEGALMEKEQQLSDLQERVNTDGDRVSVYEDRIAKAEGVVQRAHQLVDNYQQTIKEQQYRQQQLQSELAKVRQEREQTSVLLKAIEEDLNVAHSNRRSLLSSLDDLNRQLASLQYEPFNDLTDRLSAIQQEIDRHSPIANHYREQLRNVQNEVIKLRNEISAIQQKLHDNDKRLRSMPPFDDERLNRLNERIQQLSDQLTAINHQIQQYQSGNPHTAALDHLQSQESALRSACWEAVKNAPSAAIRDQLVREAEAVMRAEAAVACVRKQQQVESEAKDLARFHLERTPRVVLDEKATNVMLSECTGKRPKHEIAGIVLDMCEQRHIQIAH